METNITNLVFDIDDTIYHKNDQRLTEEIYQTIATLKENGFNIYFATRREAFNLKEVNAYIDNQIVSDIICANGLYSINEKESTAIPKEILFEVEPTHSLITIASNGYYTNDSQEFGDFAKFLGESNFQSRENLTNISSINIRSTMKSEYIEGFEDANIVVDYDDKYMTYELNVKDVNKFNKVNQVLNGEKFIGFGDNPKDDQCLFEYQGLLLKNDFRHDDPSAVDGYQMVEYLKQLMI